MLWTLLYKVIIRKVKRGTMAEHTVTINGTQYDAHTGLPITLALSAPPTPAPETHANTIHVSAQKSQTLNRAVVQKHAPSPKVVHQDIVTRRRANVAKSPNVSRFASDPAFRKAPKTTTADIMATTHPTVQKAHARVAANKQPVAHKSSQTLKHEVVAKALANSKKPTSSKQSLKRRFPRVFSAATASLAVLVLGGYLTYLNMPTISIRVAAVQAGIDASYPDYRPNGYRLSGPIAYNDGEVSMRFAATAGPQNFSITEKKSSWDSTAVLENYITPKAGDDYITYTEGGLTIYTYDNKAAWVNGGILYTIDGDAPLSNDQIRRIATSL